MEGFFLWMRSQLTFLLKLILPAKWILTLVSAFHGFDLPITSLAPKGTLDASVTLTGLFPFTITDLSSLAWVGSVWRDWMFSSSSGLEVLPSSRAPPAVRLPTSDVRLKQGHYAGQDLNHPPELVTVTVGCVATDISHVTQRAVYSYTSNCHHGGDAVYADGLTAWASTHGVHIELQ